MLQLSPISPTVPPSFAAGLVLVTQPLLQQIGLPTSTASTVIETFGSSRSAAYDVRARLQSELPDLIRGRGRPAATPAPPPEPSVISSLQSNVLDFLLQNPGVASRGEHRQQYTPDFRLFVLDLAEQQHDVALDVFADAVHVPLGTLKDWLAGGRHSVKNLTIPNLAKSSEQVTHPRIATVLDEYSRWKGKFADFCTHIQHHLRIPFSRKLIGDILEAEGVRLRKRRPNARNPDDEALRGQSVTFFSGAQWTGDGSEMSVVIAGQTYSFNVELIVDMHSAALVGANISQTESAKALISAFDDGIATTGKPPEALLVDNKPSNHADEVNQVLDEKGTIKVRATPFRPQNKAAVEGAFGLFSQMAPELRIDVLEPSKIAISVLWLALNIWGRTLNNKSRLDRDGLSRVQQYESDNPTDEEIAAARAALKKRAQQQERARQRQLASLGPALSQYVDAAFAQLGLEDPDAHFRAALARYDANSVIAGIAIFRKKKERGTLPEKADERYLLGIVKNTAQADEGFDLAQAIWQERIDAGDHFLAFLGRQREQLELDATDTEEFLKRLVDRAMDVERRLDRAFWLRAIADVLTEESRELRTQLFRLVARRIHNSFSVHHHQRLAATRRIAAMALSMP